MKTEFSFIDIVARIKKALEIKNDCDIAKLIGMSAATFSERKKANSIPLTELLALANSENIDFNWLITGVGEMYRHQNTVAEIAAAYDVSVKAKKVAELFDGLNENQQREILFAVEEKKQMNQMREQLERLMTNQDQQQMYA